MTEVSDGGFPGGLNRSPGIDRGDSSIAIGAEPSPNGNFANLGAYGGTEFASKSPSQYVLVNAPSGGEVWPAEQTFDIKWRSHDALGMVDVELIQDSNPGFVLLLADDIANPGEGTFSWTIPNSVTPADDYRIRITRDGTIVDQSLDSFEITAPVSIYYVNDAVYDPAVDVG